MIHYCKTRDQLHSCDKPLFMFSNGLILSRDLFIKQTRLYLSMIGLDPSFPCRSAGLGNQKNLVAGKVTHIRGTSDHVYPMIAPWLQKCATNLTSNPSL